MHRSLRLGSTPHQGHEVRRQELTSRGSNAYSFNLVNLGQQRVLRALHFQHLHETGLVWRIHRRQQASGS